jgi:uncharacterized phage protein gp47/JayE
MILPLQTFATLVQNMAAGVQGSAAQLIDLTVGSVLRALLEACASVALWMQWLILQVLAMTRAATSTGSDLDSWMADFSLTRLPGSKSEGALTFSRYTVGIATTIPVGAQAGTNDGTQGFAVIEDTTNPAWNGSNGYLLAASGASVTVAAQALAAGSAGNVQPYTIQLIKTPIPGIDTVTNSQAFAGGVDPESDAGFRIRFQLYINSRSLATGGAIDFVLASLQQGLRYVVLENIDTAGDFLPGHFCVVVDDGTGYPPSTLITEASNAIEAVRPIGATYSVNAPAVLDVTVYMNVVTSNPLTAAQVGAAIQQNVLIWIADLPIAGSLAVSKIEAIAHTTDPSVVSVNGTTINGAGSDVSAPYNGVLLPLSVTVNTHVG